jgi:hypothetical protein
MRVEDCFAVAVRVVGLVVFIYGLEWLLNSFLFRLGYFNYLDSSPGYYLIFGLAQVLVGLYLLRGAPHLLGFAYPTEDEDEGNGKVDLN